MREEDLGKRWPLTVSEGTVSCEGAGEVYFEAQGTKYAVNGLAMENSKFPRIDAIWANAPGLGRLKVNIGPVIDRGLELCE